MEELKLKQKKSKIQLQTEIDIAEATRKVYEEAEAQVINPPNKGAQSSTTHWHEEIRPLADEPMYP